MPKYHAHAKLAALLLLVLATKASGGCGGDNGNRRGDDDLVDCDVKASSGSSTASTCQLFMAKSTIPNAGIGMFTAVPLKRGEQVGHADLAVPITDLDRHNGGGKRNRDYHWILANYCWHPMDIAVGMDHEADHVSAFVPGFGTVANSHFHLVNVNDHWSRYDLEGLHRSRDMGVGGFTGYHGRTFDATKDLIEGSEIFVSYGDIWFKSRRRIFGLIPDNESYIKAETFLTKYHELLESAIGASDREDIKEDLWEIIIRQSPYKSKALAALPKSSNTADHAKMVGLKQNEFEESIRSVEWLRNGGGKCLDNIQPGTSTIPQAGRGAFATRFIPEGDIVAPAPLIHIPYRDSLQLYASTDDGTRNATNVTGQQLLLNYCFGHRHSTLLLCPYSGGTSFINHNSKSPNAKIVWPDVAHSILHNSTWLNQTIDFLDEYGSSPGLEFDYVATRDIEPGEEIFINYGDEWEAAWNRHVNEWKPDDSSGEYIGASILNCFGKEDDCKNVPPIRTEEEQMGRPYEENLDIYCFFNQTEDREDMDEVLWDYYLDDWRERNGDATKYPCEILERHSIKSDNTYLYTVELDMRDEDEEDSDEDASSEDGDFILMEDVPQYGIQFVNKPYSSDLFLRGAFRHEMMIPDDMMPEAWKNSR